MMVDSTGAFGKPGESSAGVEERIAAAVWEAYARCRTERMRMTMARLDGTGRKRVSVLTGLSPETVDELGWVEE